jgi:hypothetical protein
MESVLFNLPLLGLVLILIVEEFLRVRAARAAVRVRSKTRK